MAELKLRPRRVYLLVAKWSPNERAASMPTGSFVDTVQFVTVYSRHRFHDLFATPELAGVSKEARETFGAGFAYWKHMFHKERVS